LELLSVRHPLDQYPAGQPQDQLQRHLPCLQL
jgi:hypothetical protein